NSLWTLLPALSSDDQPHIRVDYWRAHTWPLGSNVRFGLRLPARHTHNSPLPAQAKRFAVEAQNVGLGLALLAWGRPLLPAARGWRIHTQRELAFGSLQVRGAMRLAASTTAHAGVIGENGIFALGFNGQADTRGSGVVGPFLHLPCSYMSLHPDRPSSSPPNHWENLVFNQYPTSRNPVMGAPSEAGGEERRRKRDRLRTLLGISRPFFRRRSKSSGPPAAGARDGPPIASSQSVVSIALSPAVTQSPSPSYTSAPAHVTYPSVPPFLPLTPPPAQDASISVPPSVPHVLPPTPPLAQDACISLPPALPPSAPRILPPPAASGQDVNISVPNTVRYTVQPAVQHIVQPIVSDTVSHRIPSAVQPAVSPTVPVTAPRAVPPTVSPAVSPIVQPTVPATVSRTVSSIVPATVSPTVQPTVRRTDSHRVLSTVPSPTARPTVPATVPHRVPSTVTHAVSPTPSPTVRPTVPAIAPRTVPPTVSPAVQPTVPVPSTVPPTVSPTVRPAVPATVPHAPVPHTVPPTPHSSHAAPSTARHTAPPHRTPPTANIPAPVTVPTPQEPTTEEATTEELTTEEATTDDASTDEASYGVATPEESTPGETPPEEPASEKPPAEEAAPEEPTAEQISLDLPQSESLRVWGAAYQQLKSSSETAALVAEYEFILKEFEPAAAPLLDDGAVHKRLQAMDIVIKKAGTSEAGERAAAATDVTLSVLDKIRSTVAELAATNPVACFAWAGFCVITPNLLASITETKCMSDGLAHVSDRLTWYMALAQVLLRENWRNDYEFQDLRSELDARLARLYKELLEFEMRCACASPSTTSAKDSVGWSGWSDLVDSIKNAEASLSSEISQYSTEAVKEHLGSLATTSEQTPDIQQRISESQGQDEDRETEKARNETIRRFQVVNYGDSLRDVPERVQGTCEWIEHNDTYRRWVASSDCDSQQQRPRSQRTSSSPSPRAAPKVLTICARPGWGKSVLARFMVETRLPEDLGPDQTICYFFFRYDQPGMSSVTNALHSILHQLLCQQTQLADVVESRVKQTGHSVMGVHHLVETLLDAVSSPKARPVVCVIDALDECLPDELSDIVYLLESTRSHNIRFLLTTRPSPDVLTTLRDELREATLETISAETFEQRDILRWEIEPVLDHNLATLEGRFDEKTRLNVRKKLLSAEADKGQRTFLWLKLVHESLKRLHLKEDVDHLLNTLPITLHGAYDLLLSRVKPDQRRGFAILLDLVLVAERPLTVEEASAAVWLRLHPKTRSPARFDPDGAAAFQAWILDTGGGFVSVSHGRLYFLHQTCKEYLLREPDAVASPSHSDPAAFAGSTTEPLAHATAAECCLLSLLLRPFPPSRPGSGSSLRRRNTPPLDDEGSSDSGAEKTNPGDHKNSFVVYATAYLTHHFNLCQRYEAGSGTLIDIDASLRPSYLGLFRRYLLSEGCCLRAVAPGFPCDNEAGPEKVAEKYLLVLRHIPAFYNDPLRFGYGDSQLAHLSLTPVFIVLSNESIWSPKTPPTMRAAGALTGSLLLFRGDEDAGDLQKPVQPVEIVGHGEFSEPVPALARYFTKQSTPLLRAAAMDSSHIVRWILAFGVKASGTYRHGDGNTVLHAAVRQPFVKSHSDTLKVLLEAGADPNVANGSGLKAITCAAAWQNWEAVRLLLAHGADPSGEDGVSVGTTPLLSAVRYQRAFGGNLSTIKMLLDAGADPNGGNVPPIAGATPEVMSLLLERGAKGSPGKESGHDTALHALMYQLGDRWLGFQAPHRITKLIHNLVKAGCPPGRHGGEGLTPLQSMFDSVPSGYSHEGRLYGPYPFVECIDALCALGADVNSRSRRFADTVVHFACIAPIPEAELGPVFQALAKHGADFGARDSAGDTALHALAWRSGEDSCRDKAGRARALLQTVLPDPNKADALSMATASEIVNARNRRGQTALQIVCRERTPDQGMLEWCRTLLAWGADAKGRDSGGNTLLHALVINAHASPTGGLDRSDLDDILDLLIARGPGSAACNAVNALDGRGRTALHVACGEHSSIDAALAWCRELLDRGADANILDN
ncbi:hypothetical protein MAPG_10167, partial [Magnaporthiopsis poae ATCC 64411]